MEYPRITFKLPWWRKLIPSNIRKRKIMQKLLDYTYEKHKNEIDDKVLRKIFYG